MKTEVEVTEKTCGMCRFWRSDIAAKQGMDIETGICLGAPPTPMLIPSPKITRIHDGRGEPGIAMQCIYPPLHSQNPACALFRFNQSME